MKIFKVILKSLWKAIKWTVNAISVIMVGVILGIPMALSLVLAIIVLGIKGATGKEINDMFASVFSKY